MIILPAHGGLDNGVQILERDRRREMLTLRQMEGSVLVRMIFTRTTLLMTEFGRSVLPIPRQKLADPVDGMINCGTSLRRWIKDATSDAQHAFSREMGGRAQNRLRSHS